MRGPRHGNCVGRLAPPRCDGDRRRPCGAGLARRRARSGARRRSPDPPGVPWRDVRSRAGPIPMLRGGGTARACCGPCSVSFPGRWGRVNGPTIRIQAYRVPAGGWSSAAAPLLLVRGWRGRLVGVCSGGVLLFRSLVGAVPLALGGLASGFGMVPGVSPPAVAAGTVVGLWCAALVAGPPRVGGWGGLVLGCVVDAGFGFAARPGALGRWCGCVGVWVCGSCRPISTGRLSPLPGLHLRPIDPVVHWGPSTTPGGLCGDLVLEVVSRLDAFSGYPSRTWPTSGAPGGTTGAPEVRPSRSSRTGDGSPQVSCARRG